MSVKAASLLWIAPTLLITSAAQALTNDQAPAPAAGDQATAAPPAAAPTPEPAKPEVVNPWFVRPPYEITAGPAGSQWKMTLYGFAEADIMQDSTRSFADGMNSNVLAHDNTQAGTNGRTQFTIRNSRLGLKLSSPEVAGIRPSGMIETDFFGNQPPNASEAAFFNNPTWRIRHAYVKLESDAVDVLMGQMYYLFGWQNYFFPASVAFLGLPNMLFNRTQQLRLSHTFKTDAVNVDFAVGAFRPPQRDANVPEGEAGLRLMVNNWKAINTPGSGGTAAFPAAIGVSGMLNAFKVDSLAAKPTTTQNDTGWGVSVNVLLPIIPARDSTDRGNALTVTGEYTNGSGYAYQFTGMTAGAGFPALPNPTGANPAPTYTPDIDGGMIGFDPGGHIHTINWQTFDVGVQYYLPPSGRVFLAANYTQGDSSNMASLFPNAAGVFKSSKYADGNIFFDVTPATRFGASYQYLTQTFCDGTSARNQRYEITGLYFF